MFGWFKSDNIYRSEIYKDEFFRLHEENAKLKKTVEELTAKSSKLMTRNLTKDFRTTLHGVEQGGVLHARPEGFDFKPFVDKEKNLLEIKLKDTDSVPEVWYEGKRLDEAPKGLFSIDYKWGTRDVLGFGEQELEIKYYEQPDNQFLDMKTISHKRVGG